MKEKKADVVGRVVYEISRFKERSFHVYVVRIKMLNKL
jgi:hypothetical protein